MAEYIKRYNPHRHKDWNYGGAKWRLSRSKIDLFLECPRCFYVDNVLGTKRPGFPSFNLNLAVDELFKKEFDHFRERKEAHPIMVENSIEAVPFAHEKMDTWREVFEGIACTHDETGLVVSGAVDDLWLHKDGSLIIVDYKATCKDGSITSLSDSPWDQQYTRQLGVYRWLFEQAGFKVQDEAYLVYANASKEESGFYNRLVFETTLVPVQTDTSWIEPTLRDILTCLTMEELPTIGNNCEYCPYREATGKKLLQIHNRMKAQKQ